MSRQTHSFTGFSLVEVAVALGVASLCLISVFALLPIGVQTNRAAIAQSAAAAILSSVAADLWATPKTNSTSPAFSITFGTATTLYFDGEGRSSAVVDANSRYRLTVTFPTSPTGSFAPIFAHLRVTWPATANVANPGGAAESFAAFDRH